MLKGDGGAGWMALFFAFLPGRMALSMVLRRGLLELLLELSGRPALSGRPITLIICIAASGDSDRSRLFDGCEPPKPKSATAFSGGSRAAKNASASGPSITLA